MRSSHSISNRWLLIPLLFLLYSSPGALEYVFFFPDEKYYTDAVLQMMDKEDYLTPYQADGTPRFKKPIITYWVLTASYKIFGVSKFSSRLFFWLAGALLVTIVFLMVKSLSGNSRQATGAAFITAANPLVLMSASRSIPDILLVLFLTISAWGFLEIMMDERPKKKYYWMAWVGAALAFETKGIPGAAFAGVSILFLLLNPWKRKKIPDLIHWPAILLALGIASSWFIIMYLEHGSTFLNSFYSDQVGERVSSRAGQSITNAFLGMGNLLAFSLPWIVIVFSQIRKLKKHLIRTNPETKAILGFTGIWVVVIILMSGAVFKFYDRYLLPVIPLVSLFFAWVIITSGARFQKPIRNIFLALSGMILLVNVLYIIFIQFDLVLFFGTAAGVSGMLFFFFSGRIKKLAPEIILSNAVLLLYFSVFLLLHPLLMPGQGEQLTRAIRREKPAGETKIFVYGNIRTASNIRIHSHHKWNVISMDTVYTLPRNPRHILVFPEKKKQNLSLKGYTIKKGSEEWSAVPVKQFPPFLQQPVRQLKKDGKHYLIAIPNNLNNPKENE